MKGEKIIDYLLQVEIPDMEKIRENCHELSEVKTRLKFKPKRLIAITVTMALIIGCVITVTALVINQKLFYVPNIGLVEQGEDETVYLLLGSDINMPEHEFQFGYWYDGTAYLFYKSTRDLIK